jgi:hypothetical protein
MQIRRPVGGLVAIAAAVLLTANVPSVAGAAPRSPATAAQDSLHMTGKLSWTQFSPNRGGSGGDTQSGSFFVNMSYAGGADSWTSRLSTFDVKDNLDETSVSGSCTTTITGSVADSGRLPSTQPDGSDTFILAEWESESHGRVYLFFHVEVEEDETVRVNISGPSGCGKSYTTTNKVYFIPNCINQDGTVGVGDLAAFNGKADTADPDCAGTSLDIKYTIAGTLNLGAYLFILPRSVHTPAEWKQLLTKPHHDYPAADIPVPSGTPYYAVTVGTIQYTTNKTCGLGITLIGADGVHYTYCHSSVRYVGPGDDVAPGDELGLTGATGSADGPHLHFQIRINKQDRCPQDLLWALYDNTQPPPDAKFVDGLPATGCEKVKT